MPPIKILLIEDNPGDIDIVHEMLPVTGPMGFQFESVSRLSEALARLERKGIDLVLLDLGLPDSQGLQTFHKLRKAVPAVPVIVLSGANDQDLAVTAVRDGAQDYLVKRADQRESAGSVRSGMPWNASNSWQNCGRRWPTSRPSAA